MENLTEDKRPILIAFSQKTAKDVSEFLDLAPEPRGVYAKQQIAEIIFRNAEEFKLHYRAASEEPEGYCDLATTAPHPRRKECVNWTPEIEHNDH